MLRGLYRFYLYTVFIAMLIFAATGVQHVLQILLQLTLLRGPYDSLPSHADVVQAVVYAVISFLTAALLGGLHYWLIRRDMRSDPAAGSGGIRAFFLNFVETIALPLAVGIGASAIAGLGRQYSYYDSFSASFSITALGLAALLECERRRTEAGHGAAIIFQRLHLYGVQLILLFILISSWLGTVGQLADSLFFAGNSMKALCGGYSGCSSPNLLSLLASTLTISLFWIGYSFLSRNDTASLIRRVFHFLGLASGIILLLIGIFNAVLQILQPLFKVPLAQSALDNAIAYNIVPHLSLGLIVVGVFALWLRSIARKHPALQISLSLTAQAIAAVLTGATFWWGCGLVLVNMLEKAFPSYTPLTPQAWANALAFVITGIAYIPLGILLRRRSAHTAFAAPLRGFVFVLLGGGILAGAIGGATALYAYGTSLLGSSFDNWQFTAHSGLAAFVVGLAIVGLYLWTSIRAGFFGGSTKGSMPEPIIPPGTVPSSTTPTPSPWVGDASPDTLPAFATTQTAATSTATLTITSLTVEDLVDELLTGKISRDEAVARIEKLIKK